MLSTRETGCLVHPRHARQDCTGRYGGTDVSGHAEGDRSGGYLQLLCPVNPVFIGASGKHQWEQIHNISLCVDESSVPRWPDSGATGLSDGPCCVSLKVRQQRKPPMEALHGL